MVHQTVDVKEFRELFDCPPFYFQLMLLLLRHELH
jgi:hypothetical protein